MLAFFMCCHIAFSQSTITRGSRMKVQEMIEKNMVLKSGQTFRLSLSNHSDITISGWEKEQAAIVVYKKGPDANDMVFEFIEIPEGIEVVSKDLQTSFKNKKTRYLRSDLEIRLSKKINLDIVAHRAGFLDIDNIEGDVHIKGNCDIKLRHFKGKLGIQSNGGNIRAENVSGNEIMIHTTDGNIGLDMNEALDEKQLRVELISSDGDINFSIPPNFPMNLSTEIICTEKDERNKYRINSDFPIDITKKDPEKMVRWTENIDDKTITYYGKWIDQKKQTVSPLYQTVEVGATQWNFNIQEDIKINIKDLPLNWKLDYPPDFVFKKKIKGSGVVNGGGNQVTLKTRNGDIQIKRRKKLKIDLL